MIGFWAETDIIFTCCQPVAKGYILGIGRPRETVGIIDLEAVTAGVCGVTVITEKERYT